MGSQMTIKLTPELRRAFAPDMIATMHTTLEAAWNALRSSESELAKDESGRDTAVAGQAYSHPGRERRDQIWAPPDGRSHGSRARSCPERRRLGGQRSPDLRGERAALADLSGRLSASLIDPASALTCRATAMPEPSGFRPHLRSWRRNAPSCFPKPACRTGAWRCPCSV